MIDKMSINKVTMVSTYQLPTHGHNVKSIYVTSHDDSVKSLEVR